jgi:DNA-binding NarL/FixJ family response regulator
VAAVIRVLVVDDQALVRQGICSLLRLAPEIELVGQAADGSEALSSIERARPDVVLLDLKMPRLDGLAVLRVLRERGGAPPVLVLTTFDDTDLVLDAIRSGARGYLLKDVTLEHLVEAIRELASGGTMIQPAITERVLRGLSSLPPQRRLLGPANPLTERETGILRLLASGLSNREIAHALSLADGTVKNHVSSVLGKLGARDRTHAVLRGLELGWI